MENNNQICIDIEPIKKPDDHILKNTNKLTESTESGEYTESSEYITTISTDSTETTNTDIILKKTSHKKRDTYSLFQTLKKMRKYRWLHKRASEHYDKIHNYLTAPTILISAVATVLSVAEINPIVLASITGLSTTLIGLSTYLKLGSKQMNHLVAAEGYDNLVTMIDFEIKFPDETIKKFASNIEKKILEIKKSVHFLPPEFIYQEFIKKRNFIEEGGIIKSYR